MFILFYLIIFLPLLTLRSYQLNSMFLKHIVTSSIMSVMLHSICAATHVTFHPSLISLNSNVLTRIYDEDLLFILWVNVMHHRLFCSKQSALFRHPTLRQVWFGLGDAPELSHLKWEHLTSLLLALILFSRDIMVAVYRHLWTLNPKKLYNVALNILHLVCPEPHCLETAMFVQTRNSPDVHFLMDALPLVACSLQLIWNTP